MNKIPYQLLIVSNNLKNINLLKSEHAKNAERFSNKMFRENLDKLLINI